MNLLKRSATELIGTFWLVLSGCGSAVLAAAFPHVGIGLLGAAIGALTYRWLDKEQE